MCQALNDLILDNQHRSPNSSYLQHSFLTIIGVLQTHQQLAVLAPWLESLYTELENNFSDYEFVLVNNNCSQEQIEETISPLPENLRKNIFLLNLSTPVSRDNAFLAGLDRANGDYAVILEFDFAESPSLVSQLWEKSQEGFDIVYLRAPKRRIPFIHRMLYGLFYNILKRYSNLQIDPQAHHSRIISRRALNSLLRLRQHTQQWLSHRSFLNGFRCERSMYRMLTSLSRWRMTLTTSNASMTRYKRTRNLSNG